MSADAESELVEEPLLKQLAGTGWTVWRGDRWAPASTGRTSFREVLLESRLKQALKKLNAGPDGQPWLDDVRLAEAVSSLTRTESGKLIEVNERMTERLLDGVSVLGLPGWDQGRSQRVQFIDFEHPERNEYLAISQFRVDEPGGQAKRFVVPDVVLFVNGIPLVVIECKSPFIVDPMAEGIEQLRRYANQRGYDQPEGSEGLFWTNQIVVSTFGDRARVGTFTAGPEHSLEWKDPWPQSQEDVAAQLGKSADALSGQELLVAGMLAPANLLDLVRHFTLFERRAAAASRWLRATNSSAPSTRHCTG